VEFDEKKDINWDLRGYERGKKDGW